MNEWKNKIGILGKWIYQITVILCPLHSQLCSLHGDEARWVLTCNYYWLVFTKWAHHYQPWHSYGEFVLVIHAEHFSAPYNFNVYRKAQMTRRRFFIKNCVLIKQYFNFWFNLVFLKNLASVYWFQGQNLVTLNSFNHSLCRRFGGREIELILE